VPDAVSFRPATAADSRPCYAIMRGAIHDLKQRQGVLPAAAPAPDIDVELLVAPSASAALTWLLGERGFRLDPWLTLFLADGPWAKLDRYLPFNPCLFL
jgi:hypothetical protein